MKAGDPGLGLRGPHFLQPVRSTWANQLPTGRIAKSALRSPARRGPPVCSLAPCSPLPRSAGGSRPAFLLFLRRPKRAPTSGPLHVLLPLPGAPFPQTVTRLDASHLPSLSRIGTSSETFSKEALLRAPGVFNSLHSMRRSHTLPDLLISSLLMSSARADAEESREACSPQGPPHLEDTQ